MEQSTLQDIRVSYRGWPHLKIKCNHDFKWMIGVTVLADCMSYLTADLLIGIMQPPLVTDLVCLPSVVLCFIKALSGGGAKSCRILQMRHVSLNLINVLSSVSYDFLRQSQW